MQEQTFPYRYKKWEHKERVRIKNHNCNWMSNADKDSIRKIHDKKQSAKNIFFSQHLARAVKSIWHHLNKSKLNKKNKKGVAKSALYNLN